MPTAITSCAPTRRAVASFALILAILLAGLGWGAAHELLAAAPVAAAPAAAAPAEASAGRPNIVVIVADDLGHGDVSSYGGDIPTPSIDALAASGLRFTAGYVTAPVCNPSRAGLMSGRYQQRWGQEENEQTIPPDGSPRVSLPLAQTTLGAALKTRGYATGAIGKWHLGMQPGYHPLDRGFDEFFGMASGTRYVDRSWPGVHFFDGLGEFDHSEPPLDERAFNDDPRRGLLRGREPVKLEEYLTDQLAREGVEFIERHREGPFFLYLAFHAPHAPLETTDAYYQRVPQFKDERKRIYAAMIVALDDGVGRVLAKLRDIGAERNTLVVFVSDNGAAEYADSDGLRNAPWTGHKRNLYEGGLRLPYIVRWPQRLPAGETYDPMVSTLDLLPTLVAAAGPAAPGSATTAGGAATRGVAPGAATGDAAAATTFDGTNLLPFLTGEQTGAPHDALCWRTGPNGAVRRGDWKLLLARDADGEREIVRLYDLARDPTESHDLAAANPAVVDQLRAVWKAWNAGLATPRESARTVVTHHAGDAIRWHI